MYTFLIKPNTLIAHTCNYTITQNEFTKAMNHKIIIAISIVYRITPITMDL